jgi:phage-related protein (TIGR01555 family)
MTKKIAKRSSPRLTGLATSYSGGNGSQTRTDGWKNAITLIGTRKDKRKATTFEHTKLLDSKLTAIYRSNGFGRRIIDLIPNDMTRNWFTITNDEDDDVAQKLEEIYAQKKLNHAMKMSRLYGGAIVLMGINDGGKLEDEVKTDEEGNPTSIKSVDFLTVFDKRDITIQSDDIESDVDSGRFGEPRFYTVQARFGGTTFKVHASRVIRFDGAELAWTEYEANEYWMDSVLQAAYEHVRQLGAVYDSSEFIVESFVQTVIKIKNLLQLIASGNQQLLKQRLNWLDMSRSVANTELLDADEEYEKHSSTVQGLDALLDRFMMAVSSATSIPVTLLMGRSPAGQNATGDADVRFYYDNVRSWQRNEFGPAVEPLIRYIFASEGFEEPDTWSLEFNPLHDMTSTEEAELYKTTAEGDAIYINAQVLDPEVIGKYRVVGDSFNATPPSMSEEDFLGDEDDELEMPVIPPNGQPPGAPGGQPPVPPGTQPPGAAPQGGTPPAPPAEPQG